MIASLFLFWYSPRWWIPSALSPPLRQASYHFYLGQMEQAPASTQRERTTAWDEQRQHARLPRKPAKPAKLDGRGAPARVTGGHTPCTCPSAQGLPGAATGKVLGVTMIIYSESVALPMLLTLKSCEWTQGHNQKNYMVSLKYNRCALLYIDVLKLVS